MGQRNMVLSQKVTINKNDCFYYKNAEVFFFFFFKLNLGEFSALYFAEVQTHLIH